MRPRAHDLLAVVVLAGLAVAVGLVSHGSHPILIALSLPLVLFLRPLPQGKMAAMH